MLDIFSNLEMGYLRWMEKFAKSFRERPKKVGKSHGFKYHQMVSDENKLFAFLISSVFSFTFFLASKYKILFICRGNILF